MAPASAPASARTPRTSTDDAEHFDVVVVGAGISGIGAGYYLGERCPRHRYVVLEGRQDLGGTWDLFRYPGVRSDSDMHTLGFRFRPWREPRALADGESIVQYLRETAAEHGIDRHIRFGHRVTRARWSTPDARWTVEAVQEPGGQPVCFTCGFLFMCTGYYEYEQGYTPRFTGRSRFGGRIVHPQHWTDDIDYEGKRVVVIGSGATAVTLVPSLAKRAAHVTMLQRSPGYIMSLPADDAIAERLRRALPEPAAAWAIRWKNILLGRLLYTLCRRAPQRLRRMLIEGVRTQLPPDYDVMAHFSPRYAPWDQRLCFVPDGDLFEAIGEGRASVVTDQIDTFTEQGIRLASGQELPADLVVTATGLNMRFLGGMQVEVDGEPVVSSQTTTYKGMMLSDVPNLALSFGYTNAAWTLKVDLTCEYVCRLLRHMEREGYSRCVPRQRDPQMSEIPFLDLESGYVQRARPMLPKQGAKAPWRLRQNYLLDVLALRYGKVDDGVMEFG